MNKNKTEKLYICQCCNSIEIEKNMVWLTEPRENISPYTAKPYCKKDCKEIMEKSFGYTIDVTNKAFVKKDKGKYFIDKKKLVQQLEKAKHQLLGEIERVVKNNHYLTINTENEDNTITNQYEAQQLLKLINLMNVIYKENESCLSIINFDNIFKQLNGEK